MKFTEDFKNEGLRVRLTMQEKADLRARLSERMALNPASPALQSPYHFFIFNHALLQRTFAALILFVFVAGSGGGTSYAAQTALPGDLLYAVKIHVNEFAEMALATSPVAKAEVQAVLAERRVEEAQDLVSQGKFTVVAAEQLQLQLDEHVAAAQLLTEVLEIEDPGAAAQINTQLASSLAVNDVVLTHLGEQSPDEETKSATRAFAVRVRMHATAAAESNTPVQESARVVLARTGVPTTLAAKAATAMSMAATTSEPMPQVATLPVPDKGPLSSQDVAAQLKERTHLVLARVHTISTQDADVQGYIQTVLASTSVLLSAGDTAFGAADYDTAVVQFDRALQRIVELETYLKAERRFDGALPRVGDVELLP